ncbi:phage major capsid protein [Rhizobium sp. CG5]|uniref:phage major capsid protein n=1 Tax=Rhizobium sp. CG5 TaxID=2726076 RepID=UPI0020347962|nr:phage major capsid protein [Rhizobium sp. CG5]MCM2472145.1 phage major capsid protein [Rhizobium sp. CG5]
MKYHHILALGAVLFVCALAALIVTAPSVHAAVAWVNDPPSVSFLASCLAPGLNYRARGIIGVRAEGDTAAIFAELKKTVEAFKEANEAELKGIKDKFADVVQTEKVDKINADISKLTKALDDLNAFKAAIELGGGGGDALNPAAQEHSQAWNKWFRKGVDNGLSDLEVKAALTTQSDPDGGFLVPKEVETTIDRVLGTISVMRQLATVMPIGTDTYTKFVSMGGATAGWVGEEESRPETATPTLREIVLTVMEMYAYPFTTQKMLDDGIIDIAAWLADEVQTTFAEMEGAAYVAGDGVKKPRGILSYPTIANTSWSWGKLGFTVSGGAAGFASTAPADALMDLHFSLKQGMRNGASWLMSNASMGTVRKMKDGDGNYLWAPPSDKADVATILGKPVYTDDNMPAIGAGTFPIAFGDFRRGYMIADRIGIRVLRNPYAVVGKVGFYTTKGVGGGVTNFEAIKLLKIAAS